MCVASAHIVSLFAY